jgi:hypothetical protein
MGALSSWAMLALVHHAIVQWAAARAGVITTVGQWYADYAILGDDVVIARRSVALEYSKLMKALGVGIGDHKSLISRTGRALEFAKRTFYNGKDVSMVPFAEFVMGRQSLAGLLELVRKYSLSFGQMLSVLGYGYRAKANSSKRLFGMPKRLRNYALTYYGPYGPVASKLEQWLPMKSVTSVYTNAATRVSGLVTRFFEQEVRLMLEVLDSMSGLIAEAKRLGTVYRDREHYGTIPASGNRRTVHGGVNPETPFQVLDSLNETVYRTAFLDSVIACRDLRTELEELQISTLDWVGLEALWAKFREIETALGALPLPRNFQLRVSESNLKSSEGKTLKRWYRYSNLFRSTVDPAEPELIKKDATS